MLSSFFRQLLWATAFAVVGATQFWLNDTEFSGRVDLLGLVAGTAALLPGAWGIFWACAGGLLADVVYDRSLGATMLCATAAAWCMSELWPRSSRSTVGIRWTLFVGAMTVAIHVGGRLLSQPASEYRQVLDHPETFQPVVTNVVFVIAVVFCIAIWSWMCAVPSSSARSAYDSPSA
ncbi:hypothetical protein [Calycomorphotria hydatis]|uniref:Rod shape-determining protein MreD n=1 Tax=Calycomorphotria hydatis TaxID=2528027 RepID=A0A517TB03_9PLAN|nr:hypothetical protein [Calycomorphotria hydatis]QDT65552.1 hypothetical protein V22_28070 [Calycomorphotria hydatis]